MQSTEDEHALRKLTSRHFFLDHPIGLHSCIQWNQDQTALQNHRNYRVRQATFWAHLCRILTLRGIYFSENKIGSTWERICFQQLVVKADIVLFDESVLKFLVCVFWFWYGSVDDFLVLNLKGRLVHFKGNLGVLIQCLWTIIGL